MTGQVPPLPNGYKLDDQGQTTAVPAPPPGYTLDGNTSTASTQPQQRGLIGRAWDWANKGLVSGDTLLQQAQPNEKKPEWDSTQQLRQEADAPPNEWDMNHPVLGGLRRGALGMSADVMDTLSGFTSPISLALAGGGAATKALPAAGKLATGMRAVQTGAGVGYGAQGAKQVYDAVTDKTKPLADRMQEGLQGASAVAAGGAALGDAAPSARGVLAKSVTEKPYGQQFSRADVLQAAQDHGVNLDLADATGNAPAKVAKKFLERSMGGSGTFEQNTNSNLQALDNWAHDEMNGYDKRQLPDTALGSRVQEQLRSDLDSKLSHESKIYNDLDQRQGTVKPDTTQIQQTAQRILDENNSYFEKHPTELSGGTRRVWNKLQELAAKPDDTWTDIHKNRTDNMADYRSNDVVGTRAEGWLKQVVGAQDEALTNPDLSKMSPQDVAAFRQANEIHAGVKSTYDNPQHPFYWALRGQFPSDVPGMLHNKTPELARESLGALGDLKGPFQRQFVSSLLDPNGRGVSDFKNLNSRLSRIPDDYLNSMVGPDGAKRLRLLGTISQKVTNNVNTSGTGEVNVASGDVKSIGRGVMEGGAGLASAGAVPVGEWVGSKLLTSPKVVKSLTDRGSIASSMRRTGRGGISAAIAASQASR